MIAPDEGVVAPESDAMEDRPQGIIADLAHLATPVVDLVLLPGNPRRGDVEAIARSLAAFGQRKAVVARRDGTVIAGNHTLLAARSLGWPAVAAVRVDDDDTTAAAYALADNRTAELGDYDDAALAALMVDVHGGADPELWAATGWTGDDLEELLAQLEPDAQVPIDVDPDDVPERAPAITRPGDEWRLGPHRLVCGNSTAPAVLDRALSGDHADLVWTDPPYGLDYVGKTADALTIEGDDTDEQALDAMLRAALGATLARCRPGAAWFVAAPPGPLMGLFAAVLGDLGVWRQVIVWVKDVFVLGHSDYHYRHEPIFYGWAPGGRHHATPDRTQDTVWEVPRPKRSEDHPTMKPVALVERAIANHSRKGAVVFDPFAGSGTTLIAAHMLARRARLVELDPRYCDVICARYQAATGEQPVHAVTGEAHDFAETP